MKKSSACDSLRPGQLDRMIDKIKDRPVKQGLMTKRRRLYISGPYRADTINGIHNNIAEARKRAEWGWANGYFPICPHLNSAFIDGLVPDEDILECYLQLVDLCHMILMVDGWKESEGSIAELQRAEKSGLEVISDPLRSK